MNNSHRSPRHRLKFLRLIQSTMRKKKKNGSASIKNLSNYRWKKEGHFNWMLTIFPTGIGGAVLMTNLLQLHVGKLDVLLPIVIGNIVFPLSQMISNSSMKWSIHRGHFFDINSLFPCLLYTSDAADE